VFIEASQWEIEFEAGGSFFLYGWRLTGF